MAVGRRSATSPVPSRPGHVGTGRDGAAYRGRFAPSPTGPMHAGSLVAALGSFLAARSVGGEWFVRIEDVDRPRTVPGASDAILRSLEAHGLAWDGEVVFQSRREEAYREAFDRLRDVGLVYPCACTRREVRENGRWGRHGPIYDGRCRHGMPPGRSRHAWRLRVGRARIGFHDGRRGEYVQDLGREIGDFVVLRSDGLFAYQLAVVVDDAWQGITEVVRGEDLLDNTPRQLFLQARLGLPRPDYLHLPLVRDERGEKLSKQNHARPLDDDRAADNLVRAMAHLGLSPPPEAVGAGVEALLDWAVGRWPPEWPASGVRA